MVLWIAGWNHPGMLLHGESTKAAEKVECQRFAADVKDGVNPQKSSLFGATTTEREQIANSSEKVNGVNRGAEGAVRTTS